MNSKRLEGGSSSLDTSMRRAWAVWIGPSERGQGQAQRVRVGGRVGRRRGVGERHIPRQRLRNCRKGKRQAKSYLYYSPSRGWVMGVGSTVIRGRWTCGQRGYVGGLALGGGIEWAASRCKVWSWLILSRATCAVRNTPFPGRRCREPLRNSGSGRPGQHSTEPEGRTASQARIVTTVTLTHTHTQVFKSQASFKVTPSSAFGLNFLRRRCWLSLGFGAQVGKVRWAVVAFKGKTFSSSDLH